MKIVYSKLKSGKNDVDDICDDLSLAFCGNNEMGKAIDAASKCPDSNYYVSELNSIKSSLTNIINEIQNDICNPISNILEKMEDHISDNLEDNNSSYLFDFDYKNNLIINLSHFYGNLKESGKSDEDIFKSIKEQYGFNSKECNDIKTNYEYCNALKMFDNYLNKNLPSVDVINSKVGQKYIFDNYRDDLIGNIRASDYYKTKGKDENFTVDKELLNSKVEALKKTYNLSDYDAKKLFAIVAREDVPLSKYSNGEIYYEAANVISSALNRANRTDKYFNVARDGDPIKQLFAPSQYEGAMEGKYNQFLDNTPDAVVDAVCDVLLSGIPSHDYDSYHGSGYVDGRSDKVNLLSGGNNYFNM